MERPARSFRSGGSTRTYGQIARKRSGHPSAVRAVGAANGRNPISIMVAPCHRVIGADGKLTGFAGGLAVKARLLQIESIARLGGSEPKLTPMRRRRAKLA